MEEWVPPAVHRQPPPTPPPPPPPPVPGPKSDAGHDSSPVKPPPHRDTYIVQVPKDQIYRVPPPENTYLAERYHDRQKRQKRTSPCLSCIWRLLVVFLLIIILLATVAVIFYLIVRPGLPRFTIKSLAVKIPSHLGRGGSRPEYDITMKFDNPSTKMGFLYESGGKVVLLHQNADIATAKTPEFYQGYKNVTTFGLDLRGSSGTLPKDIQRSMKGSKEVVLLSLSVDFPVRLKVGAMKIWAMRLDIECDFRVSGLANKAQIVSQECGVKLRS